MRGKKKTVSESTRKYGHFCAAVGNLIHIMGNAESLEIEEKGAFFIRRNVL
jgi:hypothetical protein